ncbi:hypothetical protein BO83DRAFT_416288 [Aspergillus eucalypticola CBS 122712]|uniref:Uncharacterized protein n=1 Tax=Aspergillus eucalypticola (strain CBS 122712 / IBT 29274) TaxID=1448314 RepID=A0A317VPV9_ASPEC|nr:uncharacterized protein BO83DRAFT_416288 [Aspergillus eucalypticola CBS 122712]PWY75639.1 hypothetical protein BO83DRAFT_416288 [Aspergillus eucalypticola CBS 122712]
MCYVLSKPYSGLGLASPHFLFAISCIGASFDDYSKESICGQLETIKKKRQRMDEPMKPCPRVSEEDRLYEGLTPVEGDVPLPTSTPRSSPICKQSNDSVSDTGTWGPWRSYRTVGCHQFEDQDSPCTVGTSDMFVTLEPHETWIHVEKREIKFDLPEDAQTGEVLRYQFKGCKLSWWDWRVKEDHIDTIVRVVGFGTAIAIPPDNNGRPNVLVLASNTLQFIVIE